MCKKTSFKQIAASFLAILLAFSMMPMEGLGATPSQVVPHTGVSTSSYPNITAFLNTNDPSGTGPFGTTYAAGSGNLFANETSTFAAGGNRRASSWSNAAGNPTNAFNNQRQTTLSNAQGGGVPPAPAGLAGSWVTQGSTDHQNPDPTNMGLAARFDEAQYFDTVIVFAGHSGAGAFANAQVPSLTVEVANTATFNSLPTAQTGATWPPVGAPGWTLFSEPIATNGSHRVFVFRTDTPVRADAVRVTMPKAVSGNISQVFINAFEVYNTQATPTQAPPTATPAPGWFNTPQNITLAANPAGAIIHYTTDGSTPTTASPVFSGAIHVSTTTTIRAMAVHNNIESQVVDFTYTISDIAPSPFAEHYLSQRGAGFAVIDARYDGMSNVIGHPALIDASRNTDRFPVFHAIDGVPGTVIVGTLHGQNGTVLYTTPPITVDDNGRAVITIPDTAPLVPMVTYRMAFTLTHNGRTLRDARFFTPINNFDHYRVTHHPVNSNNANVANVPVDSAVNSFPALLLDDNNQLQYFPDYRGNRIMDYSSAGFQEGAEIPNVPIVREIGPFADPYRDAWRMIQDAIDYVSARPIDPETGFRGALYLREGVYRISQPLLIATSGVVIRGAGDGAPTPGTGLPGSGMTSIMSNNSGIPGTAANPMQQQIACQAFEAGVTKIIATWEINPNYVQTNMGPGGTTGVFGVESTSIDRSSSARWDTLVHFIGPPILGTTVNFQTYVMDQYVGAGQYVIHLENTSGLSVGDLIFVHKTINPDWARAMYMQNMDGANGGWVIGGNLAPGFSPTPSPIYVERYITAIDHATGAVTLDVALADNLDMRWGQSIVRRFAADNRIRNVGIENIQGITDFNTDLTVRSNRWGIVFDAFVCENHPMQFISMTNVVDGFARNWVSYHFDRGFTTNTLSRNITVQDAMVLEPVSLPQAGARRYSLYIRHGSRVLIQRTYAHYARHAFSWSSYVSGPSVFLHSVSPFVTNASEPHFRWSSGGLFDNVDATFFLQNRWSFGTSHGHAGVNYVLYNTFGRFMASQPQISPNYVIGHWWDNTPESRALYGYDNRNVTAADANNGNLIQDSPITGRWRFEHTTSAVMAAQGLNGGWVPNFPAYEFLAIENGRSRPVNPTQDRMPESLFMHQVLDARGPAAVAIIEGNQTPPTAQWIWCDNATIDPPDQTEQLLLTSIRLNGVEVDGFDPRVFAYTYTLPFGFSVFPTVTAYTNQNVRIDITPPTLATMTAVITLVDIDHPHNREIYIVTFDSPGRTPILTSNWQQAPPFAADANFTLNLLLGNTTHPDGNVPRWASNINPSWLRLYLGYTPKWVEGVNIGFTPGGAIREYMVQFEYSLDGLHWHPIPSGSTFSPETPTPQPWTFTSRPSGEFVNSLTVEGTVQNPDNGLQHFIFDTPVEARFIRIWGDGRFDGPNRSYSAWNNYWHLSPRLSGGTGLVDSQSITISGTTTAPVGTETTLMAQVSPVNATFDDVLWESSNPSIASIDAARGVVTAHSVGTVTITATTLDGVVTPNTGAKTPFYTTAITFTVVEPIVEPVLFSVDIISPNAVDYWGYGLYEAGETVSIHPGHHNDGWDFVSWSANQPLSFADPLRADTHFEMIAAHVTVTAHWVSPGALAVVVNGSHAQYTGAGTFAPGHVVTIHAGEREGYTFAGWTADVPILFTDVHLPTTTFIMPETHIVVTAHWQLVEIPCNCSPAICDPSQCCGMAHCQCEAPAVERPPVTQPPFTPPPPSPPSDWGYDYEEPTHHTPRATSPPTPALTIPANTVQVPTTLSLDGTRATLQISVLDTRNIVASSEYADFASFNLTSLPGVTTVVLPRRTVRALGDANLGIEIMLPQGTVVIDAIGTAFIGQEARGTTIEISLYQSTTPPYAYMLSIRSNHRDISRIDGYMTVLIPTLRDEAGEIIIFTTNATGDLTPGSVGDTYDEDTADEYILVDVVPLLQLPPIIGTGFTMNGVHHEADVTPFVSPYDQHTMVPLRVIAEAVGAAVSFDGESRTIAILPPYGDPIALVVDVPLDGGMGTPVIVNDRAFVPKEYLAQILGVDIQWQTSSRTLYIANPLVATTKEQGEE